MKQLNDYIDHTLLKATATENDIINLCKQAIEFDFYTVCINGCHVRLAKKQLERTTVNVCSVIGFPLGATSTHSKLQETNQALLDGADEIDMVMNIGLLKSGEHEKVLNEIQMIKSATGSKILKVILETCYLSRNEIIKACEICVEAKVEFVKTSTGFGSRGASIEDVEIMKEAVQNLCKIKASGGIKDRETALKFIELGVDRIGTSSGISIIQSK